MAWTCWGREDEDSISLGDDSEYEPEEED